jgi:hypothetical protein
MTSQLQPSLTVTLQSRRQVLQGRSGHNGRRHRRLPSRPEPSTTGSPVSTQSFGPDKLNTTFVSVKVGDGYGMKRNIRELVSGSELTSDGLQQLHSLRSKRENCHVEVKGTTAKSGTQWHYYYSESYDVEDHDTVERLTFGELSVSQSRDTGRDAGSYSSGMSYKGKSLVYRADQGYRWMPKRNMSTEGGDARSVREVLTELAQAEGMTLDEFVTNGLGQLMEIKDI